MAKKSGGRGRQPQPTRSRPDEPRVNEKIRAPEVRVVAPDGGQIGIKGIKEARWLAAELGLDLVEVAPDARPPVVRLMDYGKYKYELSVRAREARKRQTRTVIKEVQFRPKIGGNDFDVKRRRVVEFLDEGDKVKVTMRFRGREVTHPEIGRGILERLAGAVEEHGVVEAPPRLEGRSMTMLLVPLKRQKVRADRSGEAPAAAAVEDAVEDAEAPDVADPETAVVAGDEETPAAEEGEAAATEDAEPSTKAAEPSAEVSESDNEDE